MIGITILLQFVNFHSHVQRCRAQYDASSGSQRAPIKTKPNSHILHFFSIALVIAKFRSFTIILSVLSTCVNVTEAATFVLSCAARTALVIRSLTFYKSAAAPPDLFEEVAVPMLRPIQALGLQVPDFLWWA
jgi:hypothetical protein